MALQLIHTHTLSQCRLEMAEGIELISRYQFFKEILTKEFKDDPSLALMLAEPVKNIDQDRINWYTELPGEVVAFSAMSDEQRQSVNRAIAERSEKISAFSERMKSSKSSNKVLAGELLAGILSRHDNYDIYLVGDQPVVVGWGLALGKEALPVYQPPKATPPPPPPPLPPEKKGCLAGGCLLRLLPLLLGLALGLLLVWLLLTFIWPGFWGALTGWFRPGLPAVDLPTFDLNVDREATLRLELEKLKLDYARRAAECRPPETPPAAAEPPALELPAPEPAAPEEPPAEETPPEYNEDLTIPEDAAEKNDFSFMEGCWASESKSLVNAQTKKPLIYIYCFDQNGKASVKIEEKDNKGRHIDSCRTTAAASFEDGALVITEKGGPKCSRGGRYYPSTVTCYPGDGGAAECGIEQHLPRGKSNKAESKFRRASGRN